MATKVDEKKDAEQEGNEIVPLTEMNVGTKIDMDPRDAFAKKGSVFMCRVWGQLASIKSKEAKNGDVYSYLIGMFRCTNGKGKDFESGKLYLPTGMMEELEGKFKAEGETPIKFAYDVYANYDKGVSVGYRYAFKRVLAAETTNVLADIEKEMASKPMPAIQKTEEKKAS
jgi:hypothetical protein